MQSQIFTGLILGMPMMVLLISATCQCILVSAYSIYFSFVLFEVLRVLLLQSPITQVH